MPTKLNASVITATPYVQKEALQSAAIDLADPASAMERADMSGSRGQPLLSGVKPGIVSTRLPGIVDNDHAGVTSVSFSE